MPTTTPIRPDLTDFAFKFKDWQRIDRLIGRFVSTDDARPVLCQAFFSSHDKKLRIEATDGYRLIRVDTDIDIAEDFTAMVPWGWFQSVMRTTRFRSMPVTLSIPSNLSDSVTVRNSDDTWSTTQCDGIPPNTTSLIDIKHDAGIEASAFNPKLMKELCQMLEGRDGVAPVKIVQMSKMKPLVVTMKGEWSVTALLMPTRTED